MKKKKKKKMKRMQMKNDESAKKLKKKKKNNYANKQEKKRKKYVNMHTVIRTPRSSPNKTPVSSKVSSLKSIDVVNSPK